jgi:hypothetical protein
MACVVDLTIDGQLWVALGELLALLPIEELCLLLISLLWAQVSLLP